MRPAIAVVALGLLSACAGPPGAPYGDLSGITQTQWLDDLQALEQEVARHPKLSAEPRVAATFRAAVEQTRRDLADAGGSPLDAIAVAGIARALATVKDGHTELISYPAASFPAKVLWFPAAQGGFELRLVATTSAHAAWLGGRVLGIRTPTGLDVSVGDGNAPSNGTLLAALCELVAREGALDQALDALACRTFSPKVLADPLLARGAGIAAETLTLLFDPSTLDPTTPRELTLSPETDDTELRVLDAAPLVPLSRKRSEPWWYELDAAGVMYLQYNKCDQAAGALLNEVAGQVEAGRVQALVVDLRRNGGGNSNPGTDFAQRIASTQLGSDPARLFLLVGPNTFSSAMMNAVDFVRLTRARIGGQPLVEPTTHYGEVVTFALPHSHLVVARSSKLFRDYGELGSKLPRGVVEPEPTLTRYPSFEDYAAGIDPALDAVLEATR